MKKIKSAISNQQSAISNKKKLRFTNYDLKTNKNSSTLQLFNLSTYFLLFILLMLLTISINAQTTPPAIQWQKSFGGTGVDGASSIQQTTDGGYIVVGMADSNDGDVLSSHNGDYWVLKLDSIGNIQWQKSLGGNDLDEATSVQQTNDGGYIIVGSVYSNNNGDVTGFKGCADYWVVKLEANGNIQWQKTLGGSDYDWGRVVQQTTDGGYIVAGISHSNDGDVTGHHGSVWNEDYWIVKLDINGNIQWQKSLGGSELDIANSVIQTNDGGYIVAGYTVSNDGDVSGNHGFIYNGNSFYSYDYWIVKLYSNGAIQWQKCFGGSSLEEAYSIQQTKDSCYIIAGRSASNDGDVTSHIGGGDYWIIKIDTSGNLLWQKSFGGTQSEYATSIVQTIDGGYIVLGITYSNDGDVTFHYGATGSYNGTSDYWIVKIDSIGNLKWQKSIGGTYDEFASCIQLTNDGGYIIAGSSSSNDGDVSGHHGLIGNNGFDFYTDYWVVKLYPASTVRIEEQSTTSEPSIYPNPANSSFTIITIDNNSLLRINSISGQLLKEQKLNDIESTIDIKDLSSGVYILEVILDKYIYHSKIIKE